MSVTFAQPKERNEWFKDRDGVPTTSKHRDEVKSYSVDWTDELESGETLSSSAWEASGVTTSSPALSGAVATVKVSGTNGSVKNMVVTSASRTLIRTLRFVGVPEGGSVRDYGIW